MGPHRATLDEQSVTNQFLAVQIIERSAIILELCTGYSFGKATARCLGERLVVLWLRFGYSISVA